MQGASDQVCSLQHRGQVLARPACRVEMLTVYPGSRFHRSDIAQFASKGQENFVCTPHDHCPGCEKCGQHACGVWITESWWNFFVSVLGVGAEWGFLLGVLFFDTLAGLSGLFWTTVTRPLQRRVDEQTHSQTDCLAQARLQKGRSLPCFHILRQVNVQTLSRIVSFRRSRCSEPIGMRVLAALVPNSQFCTKRCIYAE